MVAAGFAIVGDLENLFGEVYRYLVTEEVHQLLKLRGLPSTTNSKGAPVSISRLPEMAGLA